MQNNFAVRMSLELGVGAKLLAQYSMVVDFPIDSQKNGSLLVDEGLRSAVCCATVSKVIFFWHMKGGNTNSDNTQALMGQNCCWVSLWGLDGLNCLIVTCIVRNDIPA